MKPPKCRNCGAEEWRHVCGGGNVSVGRSRVTRFDTPPAAEPSAVQASSIKHRMSALGKVGGPRGAAVRAARLSPQRRAEIARAAALARWGKAV